MDRNPLVSIIITSYNYDKFLKKAIDSAITQTYRNIEVIVVDDGSTDSSKEIIAAYSNRIIPIFKANEGQASATNMGFKKSAGEIICFLDSDDMFSCNKVKRIVQLFERSTNIGWCFHNMSYIDTNDKPLSQNPQHKNSGPALIDVRRAIIKGKTRFGYAPPATGGLCFTREILLKIFPIPTAILVTDYFMKIAAVYLSPGLHVFEDLTFQRIHEDNLYTFRKNMYRVQIEEFVKIALHLRERFPEMARFTDKMFTGNLGRAVGIGISRNASSVPEFQQYLSRYLSTLKLPRHGLRIVFNILREFAR